MIYSTAKPFYIGRQPIPFGYLSQPRFVCFGTELYKSLLLALREDGLSKEQIQDRAELLYKQLWVDVPVPKYLKQLKDALPYWKRSENRIYGMTARDTVDLEIAECIDRLRRNKVPPSEVVAYVKGSLRHVVNEHLAKYQRFVFGRKVFDQHGESVWLYDRSGVDVQNALDNRKQSMWSHECREMLSAMIACTPRHAHSQRKVLQLAIDGGGYDDVRKICPNWKMTDSESEHKNGDFAPLTRLARDIENGKVRVPPDRRSSLAAGWGGDN